MSVVTVKQLREEYLREFGFRTLQCHVVGTMLREGKFDVVGSMGIPGLSGEDAAEEVFDLTNNPCRQQEREEMYGRGRSLSVGDIVTVDGEDFYCAGSGWIKL